MNDAFESIVIDITSNLVSLLTTVGWYLLVSFASSAVFEKTRSEGWKAWVPIVREWEFFRLAGMKPWWAVVLAAGSIVIFTVFTILLVFAVFSIVGGIVTDGDWTGMGIGVGVTVFLLMLAVGAAWAALTVIVMVKMMNRINRGFDQSVWWSVVGLLFFPAWVAYLGWSAVRWFGVSEHHVPRILIFPNGARVQLGASQILFGTEPGTALHPQEQRVQVLDQTGDISPQHAQLVRHGDRWVIQDLGSSTGSLILDDHGQWVQVTGSAYVDRAFSLGTAPFHLEKEAQS